MLLQPPPPGFVDHKHEFSFEIPTDAKYVWQWLNDTRTFTDTQVWPWRVEFYSPYPDRIPNGFHEGVLTNHHGPFINLAGVLTQIEYNYRDLQYNYGSYAISFRWIRPYRLEFSTEETESGTNITCTLSAYVKPSMKGFWSKSQRLFWGRFKRWSRKSIVKLSKKG
ncbi:MAG: hypothetical protein AAFX87_25970 [Bacteroidota bacterium]